MWISCALFEQKRFSFDNQTHVVFWTKVELFCKNRLKRSVLKSQFQNPRNLDEENWFFHHSRKNNFEFTTEQKMDWTCFHSRYQRNTRFFTTNAFFQISLSVAWSWIEFMIMNWIQMLLRCCLIHISNTILR